MNTLFLTAEERKAFDLLPAKMREGWSAQDIVLVPERPQELVVRRGMASFENPALRKACERLASARDGSGFEKTARSLQAEAFTREELAEMFFAIGVEAMTRFIAVLLAAVQNDEDMEFLSALTQVRSMLSEINGSPA